MMPRREHSSPKSMPPGRLASPLALFLLFGLWALMLTYPLLLHPFSHIPQGDEKAETVPLFNLWTLQWTIDQLLRGFPEYWDAPIFAPAKGTFAFSETQPLSALLAAPAWLGLQSPAFGYNVLVILFLSLNGWFACWLLKSWGLPGLPALSGGLFMESIPFVAQEMGVLQLIAVFGFLWSLLYLGLFLKQSARSQAVKRSGVGLALGPPVTFFTCSYYGLCSFFFLPLAFLFQWQKKHFKVKTVGQFLLVGLLALALTGPFLWAQRQRLAGYGFTRSAETVENNSARLQYYGNFLDHNLLYGRILGQESGQGQRLFPGFGLIGLAGLGLWGAQQKRVKRYLLVASILALLLSLGLRFQVAGFLPYQWVREYVPGFAQLRSPFRFAALLQLHLALLAGFGLHNLGRWFLTHQKLVISLATLLAVFEMLAWPLPLQAVPALAEDIPWQNWANSQKQFARVVMLPFAQTNRVADFEQTTRWMLENRHFRGEMLNGYSGFFPQDHAHLRALMVQFPTVAGIELLQEMGVDYVVVYHDLADAPASEIIQQFLPLVYWDEANNVAVYPAAK